MHTLLVSRYRLSLSHHSYIFVLITEGTSLLERASANRDQEYLHVDKLIVLGDLRCVESEFRTIKIRPRADRFISFCELMHMRAHIIGQQICTQLTIPRYIFILVTEGTSWPDKSIANRDQKNLHVDKRIVLCELRHTRTHIIGQQISTQLTLPWL